MTPEFFNCFEFDFSRDFPANCTFFLWAARVKPEKYRPIINLPLISVPDVDVPSLPVENLCVMGFPLDVS